MKILYGLISCIISLTILTACGQQSKGKHLFILSGQSNMARLDPQQSFNKSIYTAFGQENVVVVKSAYGGQPIKRWYSKWSPNEDSNDENHADLYDSLMMKINVAIQDHVFTSVSFIWMQGERDAREGCGDVYSQSLNGLYDQLSNDLNRQDVNFVIGRLSDFDLANSNYPHWTIVRQAQMNVASSNARFSWVNTDDLNDGLDKSGKEIRNDLHMSEEGYVLLGKRFATEAIRSIQSN